MDAIPVEPERQLHPAIAQLLRYFEHTHLPPHLQLVSAPFAELAHYVAETLALEGPELTTGLRKLLEGKDCVVRAALDVPADLLHARAAHGVPEHGVVQEVARDRVAQELTVMVRIPDGLPADVLGQQIAAEVVAHLHRPVTER